MGKEIKLTEFHKKLKHLSATMIQWAEENKIRTKRNGDYEIPQRNGVDWQHDFKFVTKLDSLLADDETGVVPSKNLYANHSFNGVSAPKFRGTLVLRRKIGNSFNGPIIDTLKSNTSGTDQNSTGRIRFPNIGDTSSLPNIVLYWSGTEASALPNEDVSVYGDLQIVDATVNTTTVGGQTVAGTTEAIHSIRLRFDIKAEII